MGKNYSIDDLVESGIYFKQGKRWYFDTYLTHISRRLHVFIFFVIITMLNIYLAVHLESLFPINNEIRYMIITDGKANDLSGSIEKADFFKNDPLRSISRIFVKSYVMNRESYDYSKLTEKFNFIKSMSDDQEYQRFFKYMDINNQDSPIFKFRSVIIREVNITSVEMIQNNKAKIHFKTHAAAGNEIIESAEYSVDIEYLIDDIDLKSENFKFKVSKYDVKLLRDYNERKNDK